MGGSSQAGRGRTAEKEEEETPFSLEEVTDEHLYLVSERAWAFKPLSLRGLLHLLRILDQLLDEGDSLWDALKKLDEEIISQLLSLLIRQSTQFVVDHWDFQAALSVIIDFWASPERRYLAAGPEPDTLAEEGESRPAWVTDIIERLSRNRGWTADQILNLPYLAVLKVLAQIEERTWDEKNETITIMQRAVARAIAGALGKGDALPDLPSYQEAKRKLEEAEAIKRRGRRFFDAAMR